MIEKDTNSHIAPHRWPISIEFRGRTIEGWYCIENGGVSVHLINSAGVMRRGWAEIRYLNWESMARIVLRELAELDAANSSLCVVENDRRPDDLSDGHRRP
jgi:hypothetical protein